MSLLHEIRFRSSPLIELKQLASLTGPEREQFRDLESDSDCSGLFVSKPPFTMNLKSAGRQTAELFQSLATPARIDRTLLEDDEYAFDVVDLVLDGILEIENDGEFVSGADALSAIASRPHMPEVSGTIARLSREALLHTQDLETRDPQALSMELYRYNHLPISPFWESRFAGRDAILAQVGADRGTLRAILDQGWTFGQRPDAWLHWTSVFAPLRNKEDQASYKLYVSPRPEHIRDAFETLVRALVEIPASFKLGSSAAGLLRPDKLIAYFTTREQLDEAAAMLRRELAGCDAHGVPFTAGLDDSGLLSWGVDPPESERVLRWLQRNSWRLWIVQRLGGAIAIAKAARTSSAVEPWQFAITRLQRLGVDVDRWTPCSTLWRLP